MLHLRSYVGSIVLAGLLLQGCGGSSESTPTAASQTAVELKTQQSITALTDTLDALNGSNDDALIDAKFNTLKLQLSNPDETVTAVQTAGLLSSVTDKLKNSLEKLADTSVGQKLTSKTFDIVLNSEGVTVVMLDAARGSHTITKVMIDALDADWSLTKKMIPMLQTNKEFGEKFAALAYEEPDMARFFFSRVDAPMYNALADAMLLSNDDTNHHSSVEHSTNAYMGLLMDMYAEEYFVSFGSGSNKTTQKASKKEDGHKSGENVKYAKYVGNDTSGILATDDNFVNLLADTGVAVDYNSTAKTFAGHGDANELINEKFFYALFKTPGTTDSFVAAMDKLPQVTTTELMDSIFLGQSIASDGNDTVQGYLNIISIGSAMYDGIYGVKGAEGARTGAYGFGSYTGAFIGFAGLIPSDRYMTYAKAFMNAGYEYAKFHGIDVWDGVSEAAQTAWNEYSSSSDANVTAQGAPARSAGKGLIDSTWTADMMMLAANAWEGVSLSDILDATLKDYTSIFDTLTDTGYTAYNTMIDGRDNNGNLAYPTEIINNIGTANDTVYGVHGLIELAIKEDIAKFDDNISSAADVNFTLPLFADLTMEFAYNTAYDGAMGYYDNNVNANWFADLSTNELIRAYFYPSADNIYIPSWMLAIDWLKAADNYNTATIATTDFDYNAGYFDIYVTSTNSNILTANSEIDLAQLVSIVKTIEVTKVDMGSDSILVVNENGTTENGLYVYKVRTVSPEDTQAVLAYLSVLGDSALTAIGLDSSNAANVDTTTAP